MEGMIRTFRWVGAGTSVIVTVAGLLSCAGRPARPVAELGTAASATADAPDFSQLAFDPADGSTARAPASPNLGDLTFFTLQSADSSRRFVHLMHLDGFRSDLFRALLEARMLPSFAVLAQRAKLSYQASTVDKSETMKVIESYLTSRRDTHVAGWWQFSRDGFAFKNFWLDPVEVVNYALGLEFPLYPTVFDAVAARGGVTASGFGLHRRSVPFANYARAYVEGGTAAFKHTYFDQVHATMGATIRVFERTARAGQPPAFSTSLLAAADEYSHLRGVIRAPEPGSRAGEFCFTRKSGDARKDDRLERIFKIVDEDHERLGGLLQQELREGRYVGYGYFSQVERRGVFSKETKKLCIRVPRLTAHAGNADAVPALPGPSTTEYADPFYVLGMIVIDYELGRLVDTMRSIRFGADGRTRIESGTRRGLLSYLRAKRLEGSLFEQTLFLFTGDHGMVDSKYKMVRPNPKHPDADIRPGSLDHSFIESLNRRLGLDTGSKEVGALGGERFGIDDALQPANIAMPHKFTAWQSPRIRQLTQEAHHWATGFLREVKDGLKNSLHREYWYLFFLRKMIVNPKVDAGVAEYEPMAIDVLAKLYLKGVPEYQAAERESLRVFYDGSVRMVYGGGARNNAEFFLPTGRPGGGTSWASRPTFDEILAARPGTRPEVSLIDTLRTHSGVGLLFVRKNNGEISHEALLPARMEILVMDRAGHRGTISVERDPRNGELGYGYRLEPGSEADPLGYLRPDHTGWAHGSYSEWNDLSVRERHSYHNVVAGMGSYLYSRNPAIGDITLMHSQGWNFGDNSGGHGGVHREEKITVMMASGPGISQGELFATAPRRSEPVHPTVVDPAPTALKWLGYGENALGDFARDGFESYLRAWVSSQRASCPGDALTLIRESIRSAGVGFEPSPMLVGTLRRGFERLCQGLPSAPPPLPDFRDHRAEGNQLNL